MFLTKIWARHREKVEAEARLEKQAAEVLAAITARDVSQLAKVLASIDDLEAYEDYEAEFKTGRKLFNAAMLSALEADHLAIFRSLLGERDPNLRVVTWRHWSNGLSGGYTREYTPLLEKAVLIGSRAIAKDLAINLRVDINRLSIFNGESPRPRPIDLALRGMPEVKQVLFRRKAKQQLAEAKKLTDMAQRSLASVPGLPG